VRYVINDGHLIADFNLSILIHCCTFLDYIRLSFFKQFQMSIVIYRYLSVTSVAVRHATLDSEVCILNVSGVLQ
jgi:hypothetical protein